MRFGLLPERPGAEEFRAEDLDSDLALVLEVLRKLDGRHAAGTELALDLVLRRESVA